MNAVWIIFQREIAQFFISPIAYLIAAAFFLVSALLFNNDLVTSVTLRATDPAVVPNFLSFSLVFIAPLLTMRLLAEERKEGTLELLLTAPTDDSAIVLGKFLAAWFFYTLLILVTFCYQFILLSINQRPDLGHAICAYIGIWLYGGATLSVGLLFSALTENQIVAAFLSTAALLTLYMGELAGQIVATIELARVIRNLTLPGHFTSSFAVGYIRAEDVVYFAGIIVVMLYITIRVVESHRWR